MMYNYTVILENWRLFMKKFLIPISGLIATGFVSSSLSFANTESQKKDTKNETLAEIYGKFKVSEGKNDNKSDGNENKNTKTTITQTTQIVKEEQPKSWWGKIKNLFTLKAGFLAGIAYSTFATGSIAILAETVGLTKFAEKKLGIDKTVAATTIISSGVLGAFASVVEFALK